MRGKQQATDGITSENIRKKDQKVYVPPKTCTAYDKVFFFFFFTFWDQFETFVGYHGDMISDIWRVWTSFRGQDHSKLKLSQEKLVILEAEN